MKLFPALTNIRFNAALLALSLAVLLFSCSPESQNSGVTAIEDIPIGNRDLSEVETLKQVQIRWTTHGIPHIKANDWEGLGYGFAHAIATNTICTLAREFVTVRGDQSKYFEATERNINADAFHRALLHPAKIDEYLAYGSSESHRMDAGYVAGYNNFIETQAGNMPASCNNAPWITPITERDIAKIAIGVGIRYGLGRVTNEIATSEHGLELAQLDTMDLFVDPQIIGSNALGFGRALTESGRGILLGNPHYPWHGPSRFHIAHLTLPGEVNVMGASLVTTSRVAIGFTENVAWSHTVSTALRFTMFRLDLVPGNPMAYRLGDDVHNIEALQVEVETDGEPATRTIYMTQLGPVVVSKSTPWNDQHVYAMRDVNYENYRSGDQYKDINSARNVSELRTALATHQGAAFVNTIAADVSGEALYADMSAIPNVSSELIDRCAVDTENGQRVITLNGSDPSCNWQEDSRAAYPGLMPPTEQPSLITDTYVSNSNDSYWLSNPDNRLEGFSPIIGNEQQTRSLRTRAGLKFIEEVLSTDQKFDQAMVQNLLFNHRHYGAEIFLDDILAICEQSEDLKEACGILAQWDRRQDLDSIGAAIFNRFWNISQSLRDHYLVPFDQNNPIHTPSGLKIDETATQEFVIASLQGAVASLNEAGIALDAKWGDVQFVLRNEDKIGIPGGSGSQGMFSVITSRFDANKGGYNPITHGNSYIQAVTWNDDGTPNAKAILTYSQSPEPDSEFYSDMTKLYSQSQWIDLPFTEEQIATQQIREEVLNY
ncbi:penicillin acylase family protein [bacterium]|jgi:acyl-homoserine-lactone acylase|nr:penicillin acylase family protein [bacterium]